MLNPALKFLTVVFLMSRNSCGSSKISSFDEAFRESRLHRSLHKQLEKSVESGSQEKMTAFWNQKSSKSKETAESRDTSKSEEVSLSLSVFFQKKSTSEKASRSD